MHTGFGLIGCTGLVLVASLTVGCAGNPSVTPGNSIPTDSSVTARPPDHGRSPEHDRSPESTGTARVLLAGDVMLGRRIAPVVVAEGAEVFRDVRYVVSSADVAAANLESPLTTREHIVDNPNELGADPAFAGLLAGAGFDLMSVANNHAGDAGLEGLADTQRALDGAGIGVLGAGDDVVSATQPVVVVHDGVRVAFVAFDVTRIAPAATATAPGVARYTRRAAEDATRAAAAAADVVVVSVHGGVEYLTDADPIIGDIADDLVTWGADVVWGHGSHVAQPLSVVDGGDQRRALVATSLGNFLFDQQRPATQQGHILEILVSSDGLVAYRVGTAEHADLRVEFSGWNLPTGPAALVDGEWWELVEPPAAAPMVQTEVPGFTMGDVTVATTGDVNGDRVDDLVVSYRHEVRDGPVKSLFPDREWTDALGRSAHLGVFDPASLEPIWAAGTLLRPVRGLAACDGAMALGYDGLDSTEIVATGAWTWWGFGFAIAPELPGYGVPACCDVDRDGDLDPVILQRGGRRATPSRPGEPA